MQFALQEVRCMEPLVQSIEQGIAQPPARGVLAVARAPGPVARGVLAAAQVPGPVARGVLAAARVLWSVAEVSEPEEPFELERARCLPPGPQGAPDSQ